MSFAAVLAGLFWEQRERTKSIARQPGALLSEKVDDADLFPTYGKSASCRSCHKREYELWERSHHALAERPIDARSDAAAFEPDHKIQHGSQSSEARGRLGKLELLTKDIDGEQKSFVPERVIGVAPLRQFLVPATRGRLQVTELAYDPNQADWFDVYGAEDRRPGEWGHWTGRGMTWNAMCAACHNTRLRKNYREDRDDYATSMAEMGVGCEACHGPMAAHNAWQAKHPRQTGDPNASRISREAMFSVCGPCHSRRLELTGDFRPGENFFDHYALAIPDETDIFYADGQIRDEDYEYTSFLSSRMAAAGVRCIDCHEPHSGKTRLEGNALCLSCHAAPVVPAPRIDAQTHSHHKSGERGDNCVDCHMPQTVYMQRHGRHDHGFTIPDPLLTRQIGVPNACARCHDDRDTDWALAAVEKWYGSRMERPTRARARIISRARAGESSAAGDLLDLARNETNSLWRAVAVGLLKRWSADPKAAAVLLSRTEDAHPLVRAASMRALEPLAKTASPPVLAGLRSRLQDPVRAVRVEAAWALHVTLDTNSVAGLDLLACLRHNADEPAGTAQLGMFHLDRGGLSEAMGYFRRALRWDANSASLHEALAVGLSLEGRKEEAVTELQIACRLAPSDPEFPFKLGLALNEAGRLEEARVALEEAVKLDPRFAPAWCNLGLACEALGQSERALASLSRAESIDANSPQIPYARATILARLGRVEEARSAVRRALEIEPAYPEAAGLLQSLAR